jgi:hypothetical protein
MAVFQFILCTDETVIPVEFDGSPVADTVYLATGETGNQICGTIGDLAIGTPLYTATTQYDLCFDCLSEIIPIISANTVYNVCVTCSGDTFTVETEHPIWTNQYGQTVLQMNAVTLSGKNGLNS